MKPVIIAYVPVIHKGYLNFFEKHPQAEIIYILSQKLIEDTNYLHKEIRQLSPEKILSALSSLNLPQQIEILDSNSLYKLGEKNQPLIIPREDVIEALVKKHLPNNPVTTDSVFLRWDRNNSVEELSIDPDISVTTDELNKKFIKKAAIEAEKSSDWWRQVGAVITKDNEVVLAGFNKHMPSEHSPYINGDPRNCFSQGVNIELSTAIHAEAGLIAEAAKKGISLEGASIYVTTFPCPPCAKLVAQSGISKLYFGEGYSVLDGKDVLKNAGVQIIRVE